MNGRVAFLVLIAVVSVISCGAYAAQTGPVDYLSDLPDRMSWAQEWGELGFDVASYSTGQTPRPLSIVDRPYAKGLGTISGQVVVDLSGVYARFEAEVGMQTGAGAPASSVFQVFVDGRKRFDSGVMRINDSPRRVSVSLGGADQLKLVVTDAGDGIMCDQANWADARLVRSTRATSTRPAPRVDIGQFARVVSWDPSRMDGARCSRVQEFPAEDLFLETDISPAPDGAYAVPTGPGRSGCIGLQWLERRRVRELMLSFADPVTVPSSAGVRAEYWVEDRGYGAPGASVWQGHWAPIRGGIRQEGRGWVLTPDWSKDPAAARGIWKVRWVLPRFEHPVVIERPSAFTDTRWDTADLTLESESARPGRFADVQIYNGELMDTRSPLSCRWDMSRPLPLRVRYARTSLRKADRTVIRLKLPSAGFGIAVDDVLTSGCVYVKDFGVFASRSPIQVSLADYKRRIAGRRTILEQVRRMPDQTFDQAMAKVHHAVQDVGPMLISLAADNHKIHVERTGDICFRLGAEPPIPTGQTLYPCAIRPRFGSGRNADYTRALYGGWLPVPVITVHDGGVTYRQRTFVTAYDKGSPAHPSPWLNGEPLAVAEFTIENPGAASADVSLGLRFVSDIDKGESADVEKVGTRYVARRGDRLMASLDASGAPDLRVDSANGTLTIGGSLPARSSARCYVYVPLWEMGPEQCASLLGGEGLLKDVETYWERALAPSMQLDIPDAKLRNLILASQVHCMMNARNEADGARLAMWDGSICYGPLEGDSNYGILGLDLMGQHDFARRCLDFFISRYNPEGFLTMNYTIMGSGWHMWTCAQHYDLTGDQEWLRTNGPEFARLCRWVVAQREKTKRLDAHGSKTSVYGLMPPGVEADWNTFAYYFCMNGYFYAGLDSLGRILGDIDHREAGAFRRDASQLRDEIMRAFHETQALAPVLPLRDGTWVPEYPSQVQCPAPTNDFYPGEDSNRTWCYDVEEGAPHLIPMGVMDPRSSDADWMMNHLEGVQFLAEGWLFYPASESARDPSNLGGFSKVQPYLTRTAQMHALRDDVKPFLRSYFNAVASVVNSETLSCSEHFHGAGAPTNSESMGHFLEQTRWMLLMERGEELWLAPFVTSNWLKDGLTVAVKDAPSRFGPVGYRITSHVAQGYIEAEIDPPSRRAAASIVLRLRHPQGRRIRSVAVDGRPWSRFDAARSIIRLEPAAKTIEVRANYR